MRRETLQICVLHCDDFHRSIVESRRKAGSSCPGFLDWPDILRFNWDCLLSVAEQGLARGLDVVKDYVVEVELLLATDLARKPHSRLEYAVLTDGGEVLLQRLTQRGDPELIDRAIFLKHKLEGMAENQSRIIDAMGKSMETLLNEI